MSHFSPKETAAFLLFLMEGVKMCSKVTLITEDMLAGVNHQIKPAGSVGTGALMLTKKQKNTLLYILFVFILCSAAMDFEFLVLKTDETFLAENIFCKLFALLMIYLCLEDRKLTWRSIGLRRSGITKGMILGFSIGIITFTASYLVEFILLLILGKSPRPGFYLTSFSLANRTATKLTVSAILICIAGNIINVLAEEGLFRGLFYKLGRRALSVKYANLLQALLFSIWHLITIVVWYRQGSLTIPSALLFGAGYLLTAGISGFAWGLCVTLTGTLWTGIFQHFFNNVIGSFLHVVTATGTDELQIFRLALSNVLSLLLVILLAKHKKQPAGRRQRSMKSMPSNAVRRTDPGPSNAGQRSKSSIPPAGKASKPGRRKRRGN